MLNDDVTLLFDDYKQMIEHLIEKDDKEGIELFYKIEKDTNIFVTNLFELGTKMLDKKESGE